MKRASAWKRMIGLLAALALVCGMTVPVRAADLDPVEIGEQEAAMRAAQSRYTNFTQGQWTGKDNQRLLQAAQSQLGRNGTSLKYTEQWCADFVCDAARAVGVSADVIPWDYSLSGAVYYLKYQMLTYCDARTVSVKEAQPGDLIMFDWNLNDSLDHVALVEWYDPEEELVSYIGGNQGPNGDLYKREVSENVLEADDPAISYIIRPNYATTDPGEPVHGMRVQAEADQGGAVEGGGIYTTGSQVTLTATPDSGLTLQGWYDEKGNLVSTAAKYTFTAEDHVSLTAKFFQGYTIACRSSRSGSVTGAGKYGVGAAVTLTAVPNSGKAFEGWYDSGETLIGTDPVLTFSASSNRTVTAMFAGDRFVDIPANQWYEENAMAAAEKGIVMGTTKLTFDADGTFTRAMAVTMLSRAQGADLTDLPANPFTDVPRDAWYAQAVDWAAANGVTKGRSVTEFAPMAEITRQEFTTMVVRYLENNLGYALDSAPLQFTDTAAVAEFAVEPLEKAVAAGLVHGYPEGDFRPENTLTRAEGVTIIMNLVSFIGPTD